MTDYPLQTTVTVSLPGPELAAEAQHYLDAARQYRITSDLMLEVANSDLTQVKALLTQWKDRRFAITRPLDAAKDSVMDLFRQPTEFLVESERLLKQAMGAYIEEKRHQARIEESQRREAMRAEQEKLAREAADREREAQMESARLRALALAEAAGGNQTAAAEFVVQADNAVLAGQQDAQETLERASSMTVAPAARTAMKVPTGITPRAYRDVEVHDLLALVKQVARGDAPLSYVMANQSTLDAVAGRLKDEFKCDGCRVHIRHSVTQRKA